VPPDRPAPQVHAADVVQRTATILQYEIYPQVIDDLQLMAALIAALIHDLGHPGRLTPASHHNKPIHDSLYPATI